MKVGRRGGEAFCLAPGFAYFHSFSLYKIILMFFISAFQFTWEYKRFSTFVFTQFQYIAYESNMVLCSVLSVLIHDAEQCLPMQSDQYQRRYSVYKYNKHTSVQYHIVLAD